MTEEQKRKKAEYDSRWVKDNLEQILIKPKRTDRISERVMKAVEMGKATGKAQYIIDAVKTQLDKDGID